MEISTAEIKPTLDAYLKAINLEYDLVQCDNNYVLINGVIYIDHNIIDSICHSFNLKFDHVMNDSIKFYVVFTYL